MKARRQSDWTRVESSAVRAVRYHPATGELDVRFEGGGEYRYEKVPRSKFRALMAAESVGAFVNEQIKPNHRYTEIAAHPRLSEILNP